MSCQKSRLGTVFSSKAKFGSFDAKFGHTFYPALETFCNGRVIKQGFVTFDFLNFRSLFMNMS